MKEAAIAVNGKGRRGVGTTINIEDLYAEARATIKINATGWNALGAAVDRAARQYNTRSRVDSVFTCSSIKFLRYQPYLM